MNSSLSKKMKAFLVEEQGQSTTEYILILAVMVMIVMKFRGILTDKLTKAAGTVGDQIDSAASQQ